MKWVKFHCLWSFCLRCAAGHRRRSNTAQRLEKLQLEKHAQSKIKHIQWKNIKNSGVVFLKHFKTHWIITWI